MQRLYWPTQSLPRSRTGTSELLSESCVLKIRRHRTRTAYTHNWSTSTRHLCQMASIPDPQPTVAVEMTEEEVIRAVRSFPHGSAEGPDGVRLQHILEMISCRESGSELRSALTGFVNCLLQGHIHPQVSPVIFDGNVIALEKKSGGNPHSSRLYSASHCRQMCPQLRHRTTCRTLRSDPAGSRNTFRL